jgi:hypothetical protein
MTMMAMTQAKIGLFMKKRGIKKLLYFLAAAGCAPPAAGAGAVTPNGTALTGVPGRAR